MLKEIGLTSGEFIQGYTTIWVKVMYMTVLSKILGMQVHVVQKVNMLVVNAINAAK